MEETDTIHITVVIAGRPYPLRIKEKDEPVVRQLIRDINDKVNRFQQTYANKDKQDCLAMTLLTQSIELYKSQIAAPDNALTSPLSRLEALLDKALL